MNWIDITANGNSILFVIDQFDIHFAEGGVELVTCMKLVTSTARKAFGRKSDHNKF